MSHHASWYQNSKQKGIVKYILLFLILILTLGYFNIDIRAIAEKPETQENFKFAKELGQTIWQTTKDIFGPIWDNYLSEPVLYFWNNIFLEFVWEGLKNLKAQSATP